LGTRGIPARYGGFETNAEISGVFLAEQGHQVTVYGREKAERPENWPVGLRIRQAPYIRGKYISTLSHSFCALIHALGQKNDLIHIYNVGNGPLLLLTKIWGQKTVMSVDGLEWLRKKYPWPARWYYRISVWCATHWADVLVADSRHVAKYYQKHFGVKPIFIPYGADILAEAPRGKLLKKYGLVAKEYYLCVSRFVPEKNIPLLIEAYKKSASKRKLVIVGASPEDPVYEKKIRALGRRTPGLIFTGRIFGKELDELYANTYAFVSASELEGTSPAILRALGAKKCVLISDIPENQETVAQDGLYHRARDRRDLTDKLNWLERHPEMADIFATKAQERAKKHYTWGKILQQYLGALRKLAF